MKRAEYSSSSCSGDGPGSLENERPKWQGFLDEAGEAVDRGVRCEMLRRSQVSLRSQIPVRGYNSSGSDARGKRTPRNKEPPSFGRDKVLSSIASSEELESG